MAVPTTRRYVLSERITMAKNSVSDEFFEIHVLLRKKRFTAALRKLLVPRSVTLRREYSHDASSRNHAWYLVGDCFFRTSNMPAALLAFRKSALAWPGDVQALWAIGNCYSELGKHRLAERFFRRALVCASLREKPALRFNLGNALYDQKKYESAIQEYQKIKHTHKHVWRRAQINMKRATALKKRTSSK